MTRVAALLIALLFPAALLAGSERHGFNDEGISWWSYEKGLTEAMQENKPVFLLVHADWCPTCRACRAQFFDQRVMELSDDFVFIIVDTDSEKDIARRYAADGGYIPRSMILTPNGRHLERLNSGRADYRWYLHPNHPYELIRMLTEGRSAVEQKGRLPQIVN